MRIWVKSDGRKIFIIIPNWLFTNRLFCLLAHEYLKKNGFAIPKDKLYAFMKTIKDYKRKHKDWKLVEVHSSDGDDVEIKM